MRGDENSQQLDLLSSTFPDVFDDEPFGDSDSWDDRTTATGISASSKEGGRDEILEIQKQTQQDTANVGYWRTVAAVMLLQTAVSVTLLTHQFLKEGEATNAEQSFQQYARTIADASVAHQIGLRNALSTIATEVSLFAEVNEEAEWPFITVPKFEHHARLAREQATSKIEFVAFVPQVSEEEKDAYIEYANGGQSQMWVEEGHKIHWGSLDNLLDPEMNTYSPFITRNDTLTGAMVEDLGNGTNTTYSPFWQWSPPPTTYGMVNYNARSDPLYGDLPDAAVALQYEVVASSAGPLSTFDHTTTPHSHDELHSEGDSHLMPHSIFAKPIPRNASDPSSDIVGLAVAGAAWDSSLIGVLPPDVKSIHVILSSSCDQEFSFDIRGEDVVFLGEGDLHDEKYDKMGVDVDLALHTNPNFTETEGHCYYEMTIYPTDEFTSQAQDDTPVIFALVVGFTFVLVAIVFFIYDLVAQKANRNLILLAARTSAIVTSLFPEHMRGRLEGQDVNTKTNLKSYLTNGESGNATDAPLADLFLETTCIFADIVGFTAWSSSREPSQVFTLLEKTFQGFDDIAYKYRVFKIETVGDCYVAVTGLPEPRKDHAVLMARFAQGIIRKMHASCRALEKTLGPDTTELALRVGLHSGPVTAGVLRGQRARFQLFGDTMNRCARIESSGRANRIHCSRETADLLRKAGKEAWLEQREDQVMAKGYQGSFETYWVSTGSEPLAAHNSHSNSIVKSSGYDPALLALDDGTKRLVDWNVEILQGLIRQMVAHRGNLDILPKPSKLYGSRALMSADFDESERPLDCVREIIHLPEFDVETSGKKISPDAVKIPNQVQEQLHHLVSRIASMYNANPFHNFQHASHVVMSTCKFMSRIIVAPSHLDGVDDIDQASFDHTYGITGDPLTGFACAFSALIHDVDHVGVPNTQLVKEELPIAEKYLGRSVAEQNSLDLSWDLLMEPAYDELRMYLFPTQTELARFRQLVINCVMSTDIADKELKAQRNQRWEKAFKNGVENLGMEEDKRDEVNRKATIVIEHIIQASDISHTMQHWHVYRKWNQNLFEELYVAYMAGRMEKDPSTFWYQGEFGFFDFYIIPLTRKLKECGVFGVSSDECLNYALNNRAEWEARGEDVVAEMIEECQRKYGTKTDQQTLAPTEVEC